MDLVTNKTIDKLKYDLVRNNIITFEDIEKAQEMANVQNINLGQVLINTSMISEHDLLNIKNFGKKSSDEVIERLHHFGLDLAPSPVEEDLIG